MFVYTISGSFWYSFGIILGYLWYHVGIDWGWILGYLFRDDFGIIFKWFRDDFVMILSDFGWFWTPFWDPLAVWVGMLSGRFWVYFLMISGWFWDDFGMILDHFGHHFGAPRPSGGASGPPPGRSGSPWARGWSQTPQKVASAPSRTHPEMGPKSMKNRSKNGVIFAIVFGCFLEDSGRRFGARDLRKIRPKSASFFDWF